MEVVTKFDIGDTILTPGGNSGVIRRIEISVRHNKIDEQLLSIVYVCKNMYPPALDFTVEEYKGIILIAKRRKEYNNV